MQNITLNHNKLVNNTIKEKPKRANIAFKGALCDEYVKYCEEHKNKQPKDSFLSKYFSAPCAIYPTVVAVLGIELAGMLKSRKAPTKEAAKLIRRKTFKNMGWATLIGVGFAIAVSSFLNSKTEKNLKETKDYFNSINKTNAKLSEKPFASSYMGAYYQPATGEINLNYNFINDPWNKLKTKYILKHELVHAKQFETIARMDDGIEKLNYFVLKSEAESFNKNPVVKADFEAMYNEIMNESPEKYQNKTMLIGDRETPIKDYIIAMHKLMNNEVEDYHKLPILINSKHYEEVREKSGKLSPEEKQKAEEYYKAAMDYSAATFWSAFNPFSKYRKNLLEKEAFNENPWWTQII